MKKGISLIVLVITIIVMIILAASVVITLSNTGIINKASEATSATNLKQVEQIATLAWADAYSDGKRGEMLKEDVLAKLDEYKDAYDFDVTDKGVTVADKGTLTTTWRIEREYDNGLITKAVVTDGTVSYEIGTTVNYMPSGVGDTSYKKGWKLLGVDEVGRLLIMSSDDVTSSGVKLRWQTGYVNGLTQIQNAVNSYKDGTYGISVRSVKTEDIDNITGFDKNNFTGAFYWEIAKQLYGLGDAELMYYYNMSSVDEFDITGYGLDIILEYDNNKSAAKYSYDLNENTRTGYLSYSFSEYHYYDMQTQEFNHISVYTPGVKVAIKNTAYGYHVGGMVDRTSKIYSMLSLNSAGDDFARYWVANTNVIAYPDKTEYTMSLVNGEVLNVQSLFNSHNAEIIDENGELVSYTKPVRAVVTLDANVSLKESSSVPGTYDLEIK